jgi:hypothetical protein
MGAVFLRFPRSAYTILMYAGRALVRPDSARATCLAADGSRLRAPHGTRAARRPSPVCGSAHPALIPGLFVIRLGFGHLHAALYPAACSLCNAITMPPLQRRRVARLPSTPARAIRGGRGLADPGDRDDRSLRQADTSFVYWLAPRQGLLVLVLWLATGCRDRARRYRVAQEAAMGDAVSTTRNMRLA